MIPKARPDRSVTLSAIVPLVAAALVAAARQYRGFPEIDDFVYIPMAWAAMDPSAFPGDWVIAHYVLHAPVWVPLVALLESSLGFPLGYWILTQLLTIGACAALYAIWRRLGGDRFGFLVLPVALAAGTVLGIGRGQFDGLIAPGFHVQSLALTFLLASYAAAIARRPMLAGVALALSAMSHPVVATHGALVLIVMAAWDGSGRWARLLKTGLVAAAVAAPVTVPLAIALLAGTGGGGAEAARQAVIDGYLFRTPHEFALEETRPLIRLFVGLLAVAGLAGGLRVWRAAVTDGRDTGAVRRALGLMSGHALLFVVALAVHGGLVADSRVTDSTLPYLLHLTRTTPVLIGLSLLLAGLGLSLALRRRRPGDVLGAFLLIITFATVALYQSLFQHWAFWAAIVGGAVLAALSRRPSRALIVSLGLIVTTGFAAAAWRDPLVEPPPPGTAPLYAWVQAKTPTDALFVVPPGLQSFRLYTRRSVVVDFKTFPASTTAAIAEWRRRLELVSRPDAAARGVRGWHGLVLWDRAYADADAASIAALLAETGADYFVWPRLTRHETPFNDIPETGVPAPPADLADHGLAVVYGGADTAYLVIAEEDAP